VAKRYEGLCAGGPNNGRLMVSEVLTVHVPVIIPGARGIGQGEYRFNQGIEMWVWQGQWPYVPRTEPTSGLPPAPRKK
jgi:hypothetical protein